jgi:hypothetical protein
MPPTSTTNTATTPATQRLVSPGEFRELVGRGRRPREDGLVVEMAADVGGQLRRGRVAPVALLREGLRDHRLHVAAKGAIDRPQRGRLLLADRAQGIADRPATQVVGKPPVSSS